MTVAAAATTSTLRIVFVFIDAPTYSFQRSS